MALLYHDEEVSKRNQKIYVDRTYFSRYEDQVAALRDSCWVYVGNMSFHTSEAQLYALFSRVGPVNRVIMGLNSRTKTPCGFGFVQFFESSDALESVAMVSGTILDNRQIRVELDFGYKNGRHLGRGQTGNQVRDDRRGGFDPGRTWAADTGGNMYGGGDRDGGGGGGGRELPLRDLPSPGAVGAESGVREDDTAGGEKRGRSRRDFDEEGAVETGGDGKGGGESAPGGGEERGSAEDDADEEGATRSSKRRRRADSDDDDDEDDDGDDDE